MGEEGRIHHGDTENTEKRRRGFTAENAEDAEKHRGGSSRMARMRRRGGRGPTRSVEDSASPCGARGRGANDAERPSVRPHAERRDEGAWRFRKRGFTAENAEHAEKTRRRGGDSPHGTLFPSTLPAAPICVHLCSSVVPFLFSATSAFSAVRVPCPSSFVSSSIRAIRDESSPRAHGRARREGRRFLGRGSPGTGWREGLLRRRRRGNAWASGAPRRRRRAWCRQAPGVVPR
jgi:hypothetical protein